MKKTNFLALISAIAMFLTLGTKNVKAQTITLINASSIENGVIVSYAYDYSGSEGGCFFWYSYDGSDPAKSIFPSKNLSAHLGKGFKTDTITGLGFNVEIAIKISISTTTGKKNWSNKKTVTTWGKKAAVKITAKITREITGGGTFSLNYSGGNLPAIIIKKFSILGPDDNQMMTLRDTIRLSAVTSDSGRIDEIDGMPSSSYIWTKFIIRNFDDETYTNIYSSDTTPVLEWRTLDKPKAPWGIIDSFNRSDNSLEVFGRAQGTTGTDMYPMIRFDGKKSWDTLSGNFLRGSGTEQISHFFSGLKPETNYEVCFWLKNGQGTFTTPVVKVKTLAKVVQLGVKVISLSINENMQIVATFSCTLPAGTTGTFWPQISEDSNFTFNTIAAPARTISNSGTFTVTFENFLDTGKFYFVGCAGSDSKGDYVLLENSSPQKILLRIGSFTDIQKMSVKNPMSRNEITIFGSNVISEKLQIDSKIVTDLSIFSLSGKLIKHVRLKIGQNQISCELLVPGIYLYSCTNSSFGKFLKK